MRGQLKNRITIIGFLLFLLCGCSNATYIEIVEHLPIGNPLDYTSQLDNLTILECEAEQYVVSRISRKKNIFEVIVVRNGIYYPIITFEKKSLPYNSRKMHIGDTVCIHIIPINDNDHHISSGIIHRNKYIYLKKDTTLYISPNVRGNRYIPPIECF